MKLKELLQDFIDLDVAANVSGLCLDSRQVRPGDLFFAYPGFSMDRRDFIDDAISRGARVIVCEQNEVSVSVKEEVVFVTLPEVSQKIGMIAARFYQFPSRELFIVAVTGTNGKTSCSYLLAEALQHLGCKVGLIGTLGIGVIGQLDYVVHTTPDPITLQKKLSDFKQQGIDTVVMEASSHALVQGRLNGVNVACGIFTNLTHEHLDYHHDMHAYAAAKRRLFDLPGLRYAVLNLDDPVGAAWADELSQHLTVCGYGMEERAVNFNFVFARSFGLSLEGIFADIVTSWGDGGLQSCLLGEFNVSNLLAVFSVLCLMDFPLEEALSIISTLSPVPARLQLLRADNRPKVIIDFAHTSDALEKVLSSLRAVCSGKLYCVFGCGGDRDKGKRPLMAKVVERYADQVIVTDDNPRFEDPDQIIEEILVGFENREPVIVERDREKAIRLAIHQAEVADIVLIAGRGHETHQIIGTELRPLSDIAVAEAILKGLAGKS